MKRLFVNEIRFSKDEVDSNIYPFNIKCLRGFEKLRIDSPVTFFAEKMELVNLH